jgi:hypothetical protein
MPGEARPGTARQGKVFFEILKTIRIGQGWAWHGAARHGPARTGVARLGKAFVLEL